ncbi:MAG: ribonuclease P [Rikenellaceae bacterium]|nr:ribonuclease P [Rikenellaceae bacterium]
MGNTFSALERVKLRSVVAQLFGDCASGFVFPIKYKYIVEESTAPGVAVLFSVPKRLHKRANRRNLLRRRMRESYRLSKEALRDVAESRGLAIKIAFIYVSKEELTYKAIDDAIVNILAEIQAGC